MVVWKNRQTVALTVSIISLKTSIFSIMRFTIDKMNHLRQLIFQQCDFHFLFCAKEVYTWNVIDHLRVYVQVYLGAAKSKYLFLKFQ